MAVLSVENITKSYDSKLILGGINLKVEKGEFCCILGASGEGKTTLFNLIAGLENPDSGRIVLNDTEITGQSGKISYMLQKDLLFPHYSILQNVTLPAKIRKENMKLAKEKALPLFKAFGLEGYENKYPNELSGGMRQRAALLRTYLFSNEIVLLDEPFSALDMVTKANLHGWYLQMARELSLTTLFISHDIDEAIRLADRILILGRNKEQQGAVIVREIFNSVKKENNGSDSVLVAGETDLNNLEKYVKLKNEIVACLS